MWPLTPFTYSETPVSNRKAAPALSDNTTEILTEMLGYSWGDVVALMSEGVIL